MRGAAGLTLAGLMALAVACSSASPAMDSAQVGLFEYGIDVDASTWSAGGISLDIANDGEFAHTLIVTNAGGQVVGATDLVAPGAAVSLDLDLAPGSYRVSCRIVVQDADGAIIDHFEEGMRANVRVVG